MSCLNMTMQKTNSIFTNSHLMAWLTYWMLIQRNGGRTYLRCIILPENKQEILDKYDSKYAVSKMSITTPNVLKRFSNLRPFNKILVGAGCKTDENGNVVIPTLPYLDAKKRECIQYMPFANYTTGEKFPDSADTIPYWKPLSETLDDYANHKEAKSGGDVGLLPRLRMKIGQKSDKICRKGGGKP